jgi:hypothetical protein
VGYQKHGNFVELSKCPPDWQIYACRPTHLFSYKLHNVGEHLARFINDLGALPNMPLLRGQHAWSCQGFLGGPAEILNDLYLFQFQCPGHLYWDDGDIVPFAEQVVFPTLCGS